MGKRLVIGAIAAVVIAVGAYLLVPTRVTRQEAIELVRTRSLQEGYNLARCEFEVSQTWQHYSVFVIPTSSFRCVDAEPFAIVNKKTGAVKLRRGL